MRLHFNPLLEGFIYSCSTWECVGDQKGLIDKRSIKYHPPAIQGGEDYTLNRLDQAEREMERMFGEDG